MDNPDVEGGDNDTPRQQGSKSHMTKEVVEISDDDSEGNVYVSPFPLKKMRKTFALPDDTEAEDNDLRGKVGKKAAGSNNKVR